LLRGWICAQFAALLKKSDFSSCALCAGKIYFCSVGSLPTHTKFTVIAFYVSSPSVAIENAEDMEDINIQHIDNKNLIFIT
jgi:hypothetical protein